MYSQRSREVDVTNNTDFKRHIWRTIRLCNKIKRFFPKEKWENHCIPYFGPKNF